MTFPVHNLLIAIAMSSVLATAAMAQNRGSMAQGRSALGQGNFGQSAFGQGGQTGRSAFGGTTGRGQSRGGGRTGGSAFGGSAFGGGTFGAMGGTPAFGGNQFGAMGQGNFIGSDAAQTQNFFRNLNRGQRSAATFDFMIENLNEMRNRGGQGSSGDNTPPVRVKLYPTFEIPSATVEQMGVDLQTRLTMNVDEMGVAGSRISIDGRTVVLEGQVETEHQRVLVAKLVSLEPGVTTVDNRLTVEPNSDQED